MRPLRTCYWLLILGFTFVLGFAVTLHAQGNPNCSTNSRVETYYDPQGKVQLQKIEIKSAIPGRLIAAYSLTSPTLIPLTKFWALRRKAYLACAGYYEKIEQQRAREKGSLKSATILAILPSSASTATADETDTGKSSMLASHDK